MRFLKIFAVLAAACGCMLHAQDAGKMIFPDEDDYLMLQWGRETVEAYLAMHGMAIEDNAPFLRRAARQDLRDDIRAFAWLRMVSVIEGAAVSGFYKLTPPEQRLLEKHREAVILLRNEALEKAVAEKNRFREDMCGWKPDEELAKTVSYSYNGNFFCPKPPWVVSTGEPPPPLPPKEYFLAFGQKKSWVDAVANRQDGILSISRISQGGILLLSIAIPAAIGLGIAIGVIIAIEVVNAKVFPYANAVGSIGPVGVAISIALFLITVAFVVYLYTENDRVLREQDTLDAELAELRAADPPGYNAMWSMLENSRNYQLLYISFVQMMLPKNNLFFPGPLPEPGSDDAKFIVRVPGQTSDTVVDSITFPTWPEGAKYRARIWNGWFLFDNLLPKPNTDPASINTRFRYYRDGVQYELDRLGYHFAISKVKPASTDVECPANGAPVADFTKCKSYVSNSFEIDLDGLGRRVVSLTQPVVFTSPLTARVALGTPATIPIEAAAPGSFTFVSATTSLPPGFTFYPGLAVQAEQPSVGMAV